MTRTWFPEVSSMPSPMGGYVPLYRWYIGDSFRQLKAGPFETAAKARNAARDFMAGIIDGKMRADPPKPEEPDLGRSDWLAGKQARASEERAKVFGDDKPSLVFIKGRQVPVERRKIA